MRIYLGKELPTFAILFLVAGISLAVEKNSSPWLQGLGAGLIVLGAGALGKIINLIVEKLDRLTPPENK